VTPIPFRFMPSFEQCLTLFALLVVAFLTFPTLIIIPMSFGVDPYLRFPPRGFTLHWYASYFADRDWISATWFSLRISTATACCSVVLGTAAALALMRSALPSRPLIRSILLGPIILPQIVVAIALLLFYQHLRMVGSFGAFVVAHTCLAVPYVIFTVTAALQRYDADLDAAALMCGATRWTITRRVTLPLIAPGLVSGALFAFLFSFDEPVVAFFLSGLTQKVMARKFFEDLQLNVSPTLAAVATLLTALTIVVLSLVASANHRREKTQPAAQ
jgi:mannopine transport system permease protein